MSNYQILKHYGFSPIKAAQIALDVERNDSYAIKILTIAKGE